MPAHSETGTKLLIFLFISLFMVSGCGGSGESDRDNPAVNDGTDAHSDNTGGDDNPSPSVAAKICDIPPRLVYTYPDLFIANQLLDAAPISDGNLVFFADDPAGNQTLYSADIEGDRVALLTRGDAYQPSGKEAGYLHPSRFAVAPLSSNCGIAERVVVEAVFREESTNTAYNLIARIPDIREKSLAETTLLPQTIDGTEINSFPELSLSDCGDILAVTGSASFSTLGEGNTFSQILAQGSPIPMTNSPGNWGRVERLSGLTTEVDIVAQVENESTRVFGRLLGDPINHFRCFASTSSTEIDCNINGALSLDSASSTRFAVMVEDGIRFVNVTAPVDDAGQLIPHAQSVNGIEVLSVEQPNVCATSNDIYFVGNHVAGNHFQDDIFVYHDTGQIEAVTDFAVLATGDEAERVPQVIEGFSLGEFCDIAIQGRNGSQRSIWSVWRDGTLARIIQAGDPVEIAAGDSRGADAEFNMGSNSFDGRPIAVDNSGRISIAARLEDPSALVLWALLMAEQDQDICRVPARVNVTTDADDTTPGDGYCDTGATLADGQAECSLRAAIMEANAQPGEQKITFDLDASAIIRPTRTLPELTDPVTIDAPYGLTVDLSSAGTNDGLSIAVPGVVIRGLALTNAPTYGINIAADYADTTRLSSVSITHSCDFGLYTGGHLIVDDALGQPSYFAHNGGGPGCNGGGILSTAEEEQGVGVRLTGVELNSNAGPGLLATAPVVLSRVTANDNQGSGIAVTFSEAGLRQERVRLEFGHSDFSRNQGDGIYIDNGYIDVKFHASLSATENNGWGLYIDEGKADFGTLTNQSEQASVFSHNGQPGDYFQPSVVDGIVENILLSNGVAGGMYIFSADDSVSGSPQRLHNLVVEENGGPGILTSYPMSLSQSSINANQGDGIVLATGELDGTVFRTGLLPSTISNNGGHGITLEGGKLVTDSHTGLTIEQNSGWGIFSEQSVTLGTATESVPTGEVFQLARNGTQLEPCRFFSIDLNDFPVELSEPCSGGGIRILAGDLSASHLYLVDNQGPAVEASGTGNIEMSFGKICGNVLLAAGSESLNDMLTCP